MIWFAALIAGAILPAAFAPFALWPLAILSPAVLFFLWRTASARRAAALGFVFGLGTYTTGTYWLYTSIHGFGQAPAWLAILLMAALIALMATYTAVLGWLIVRFLPTSIAIRWLLGAPALWVLLEWVRGWFLSGFGWLSLGYSQTDTILAGFAPLGGMSFISLILVAMAGATVILRDGRGVLRGVAAAVLLVPAVIGVALSDIEWTESAGPVRQVAIVQGAIPQDQKWLTDHRETTLDIYRSLTEQALPSDLIVWPEAAIPDLANHVVPYLLEVGTLARDSGAALAMGLIRSEPGENLDPLSPVEPTPRYFNSILAWQDDSLQWYDKHHLVPFGEFFPVPAMVRQWLRLMNLPYADFTRGAAQQAPLPLAGLLFAASICYEDAYATSLHSAVRQSAALINVTNDAWFGRSTARYQHLQIARMRSIEARRYQLRAANDGVSAVIDPLGKVIASAPEYQPAVLRATIEPRQGLTPYIQFGNVPVLGLSLLMLGMALWRRRREARRGSGGSLSH